MRKNKLTKLISGFLSLIMLGSAFGVTTAAESEDAESSIISYDINDVKDLLSAEEYSEYAERNSDVPRAKKSVVISGINYNKEKTTAKVKVQDGGLYTPNSGIVAWDVEIPSTGKYALKIEYSFPDDGKSTSIERRFRIDDEYPFKGARYLSLTKVWRDNYLTDENGNVKFKTDLNGNDIRPEKRLDTVWCTYVATDSTGYYINPFEFVFEKGKHTISLEASREEMIVKSITLYPYEDLPAYADVKAEYEKKGYTAANVDPIILQGEYPSATSDSTIYASNDRTSAITQPQDTSLSKLNYIGSTKWQTVGQWVEYTFTCEATGLYEIVPRYKQADLSGMYTSRRIYINGEIPFEEASYFQFNYSDEWKADALGDGETSFEFYFEEGKEYTIRIEVVLGSMSDIIGRTQATLTAINADYLKILQITGADPDNYRDYNFNVLIPDTIRDMYMQSLELYAVAERIAEVNGEKGSNTATLENIARVLQKMSTDEDQVARNLDTLKSYIGTLGTWLNNVRKQPLSIDYISIQPSGSKLPKAEANFFEAAAFEIGSFVMSFFTDYSSLGATVKIDENDVIDVWTQTDRDSAQVIRTLCDNYFASVQNIGVNIRLVSGGTLLPATLSGMGPDVSMENGQSTPVQYAIRNAVQPLNDFDTFDEVVKRFSEPAIIPLSLYGTTYGLPETQSFDMLFYRKDILADLNLDIPKTWDELMAIVPVLQYNNMTVGVPRNNAGLLLLLYQMGGELYADDGMRINLDSNLALEAFDTLCSYFTQYSFPISLDEANRFRTGEVPILFADYISMYNKLTVFATEIKDLWEFVPAIGTEDAEGNINNTVISTVSSIMMMNGCENREAAWKYMDWFTSAQTQSAYANEKIAIVGPGSMYATANKEALESLPWSTQELENILTQYNNLAIIPEMPGGYIISRYVGFAFLDAYNNHADPVDGLLGYIDEINKEITRKRKEFDLDTLELGETLADREAAAAENNKAE